MPATILNSIPALVIRFDRRQRIVYANRPAADHFALTPEAMAGRTLTDVGVGAGDAERHRAVLDVVFADGLPVEYEHPATVGDTTRRLFSRIIPESGADGRVESALAVTTDMTAVTRAEAGRAEAAGRFTAFMTHAPAVMWIKGPDGRYQTVSRRMGELFGGAARWLGKTDHEVLPKEVADTVAEHDRQVRETGVPMEVVEDVPTEDGLTRPWLVVKFPIPNPDGTVSVGGVALDLSERRRAEEERQRAEKRMFEAMKLESLGVLAGGIAHDFNNLLTTMLGYASLAGMELAAGRQATLPAHLGHIETAAGRAADLCKQMLAYAGKGQFQVGAVNLPKLVAEIAQLLQASISKKAVLRLLPDGDPPAVMCDPTQIRQVVLNLITNASDAIGDKSGVITVGTGAIDADAKYLADVGATHLPPGRYAYVEVSDTGCGMDAATAARIFEPFFTTKTAGRGLGLSAIQGIARGHGGAIKVYSQPGRGTTFKVLLPASDQTPAADPPPAAALAPDGGGRVVLVIDDEEDIRVFARKVLEGHGFAVVLAPDGRAGEAAFRANPPGFAAVLCDLTMPHQDGATTFRRVRQIAPAARVVLMSGYSADEATAGLNGMGLAGFLRKPFRAADLLRAVFEAVGTS